MNKLPIYILYPFFLCLGLIFLSGNLKAQDKSKADSLIYVYETQLSDDSTKFTLLEAISFNHPNPKKKIYYARKLINMAHQNRNYTWLYYGYLNQGLGHRLKGDLELAVASFYNSLKYAKLAGKKKGIGTVYIALADVYSINNDHKKSIAYYYQGIDAIKSYGSQNRLAAAFLNLGDEYYLIGNLDSALYFFHKSEEIYDKENNQIGLAYNYGNVGLVYAQQGDHRRAEENLNRAISILSELKDFYPISVYLIQMSDIYNAKGDSEKAFQLASKSLELAQEHGLKEQIQDACLKLSELYYQANNFEKAYQLHTRYVAYRDSINNEQVIREMAALQTEFEVSQKQAEIDLLKTQRRNNQIIGLGLIIITVLLATLAFVLLRNNRIKQQTNKILSLQKDELQQQHYTLEALNNTKDRFFSIISHDLRGPVNAFKGVSELIGHYISRNEMGQLQEVSGYIDKSARQLSSLLDNLLDWSVKQQGTFPFFPEKVQLNALLEETTEMFLMAAHGKKIMLTVNLEEKIDVWADKNSLMTIVRNLVNNALKFTEENGLVTVSAYQQRGFAMISIIDTGIGIPEEKLDKLFKPKEKSVDRGTAGEKGLGIGLSLAYEFAEMNKGTIMVTSEENAGTIFTVKIPLFKDVLRGKNKSRPTPTYHLNR